MLPGPGLESGSVYLLPAHRPEHHQADLLLQPGREGLGARLHAVSLLWFRWVGSVPVVLWSFSSDFLFVCSAVAFKEICPAGPGYHYSASTLQISQRVDGDSTGRESVLTAQDASG